MGFLFFVVIVGIIVAAIMMYQKKKEDEAGRASYLDANNVRATKRITWSGSTVNRTAEVVIDDQNQWVLVSQSHTFTRLTYDRIIGCEIRINDEVRGGVGRAVTGGLLLGGVGAIVGAATAKKKITSMEVAILRENINHPQYVFTLIDYATDTDDPVYKRSLTFANEVCSSIKAIISKTTKAQSEKNLNRITESVDGVKNKIAEPTKDAEKSTPEERLQKLKKAHDSGLITDEEYADQRKTIISEF